MASRTKSDRRFRERFTVKVRCGEPDLIGKKGHVAAIGLSSVELPIRRFDYGVRFPGIRSLLGFDHCELTLVKPYRIPLEAAGKGGTTDA